MAVKVVAECGASHEGDPQKALRLISEAASAGCDACKFQLYRAESLYEPGKKRERARWYELPLEWLPVLRQKATECGLEIGYSVFSPDLCEHLVGQADFVKISAYDLTYHGLIRAATRTALPVVFSTAMATAAEIRESVALVPRDQGCILLHGVAAYPTLFECMNLSAVVSLREAFNCRSGLSDHTEASEVRAAVVATALGADMIEVHCRLDGTSRDCPDFANSRTPGQLGEYVRTIRRIEAALGDGRKCGPLQVEIPLYDTCRRTDGKKLRSA